MQLPAFFKAILNWLKRRRMVELRHADGAVCAALNHTTLSLFHAVHAL